MFKSFIRAIKKLLGFPLPPREEQVNEKLITMREERDCAVAAVATACAVSYEAAHKAIWHWNLPFFLESPLLSNPLNVVRAVRKLGFNADDKARISALLKGELPAGKTICLMHDHDSPFLAQHWVVYMGRDGERYLFHWGQYQTLRVLPQDELVNMLTAGWPNCIIEVTR